MAGWDDILRELGDTPSQTDHVLLLELISMIPI